MIINRGYLTVRKDKRQHNLRVKSVVRIFMLFCRLGQREATTSGAELRRNVLDPRPHPITCTPKRMLSLLFCRFLSLVCGLRFRQLALRREVVEGKRDDLLLVREVAADDRLGIFLQDSWQISVDLFGPSS